MALRTPEDAIAGMVGQLSDQVAVFESKLARLSQTNGALRQLNK